MAPALVEELVQDVDLGVRLIETAEHVDGDQARRPRRLAAVGREQLGGNDALQILIEPLEKAKPAPVALETHAVELFAQSGESLGKPAFDLGLEQAQALLCVGIGH